MVLVTVVATTPLQAQPLPSWQLVPAPLSPPWGTLTGIAAASPRNVWTVGSGPLPSFGRSGQINQWDGASWSVAAFLGQTATRTYTLSSVWATSANDVWAVGRYNDTADGSDRSVIMHWDGRDWNRLTAPVPDSSIADELWSVSATSATDAWAVGSWTDNDPNNSFDHPLIEHWDGTSWSVVRGVPDPGAGFANSTLFGVYATAPDDVWAVGQEDSVLGPIFTLGLVVHWNGTSWTTVDNPRVDQFTDLSAIAADSADDVWLVGTSGHQDIGHPPVSQPLVEHWTPASGWTVVENLHPDALGGLWALVANSPIDVTAVGDRGHLPDSWPMPFSEHWDGIGWVPMSLPDSVSRLGSMRSVCRDSVNNLWAVDPPFVLYAPSNGNSAAAYVTNAGSHSVSVVATASNTVIRTISVGTAPSGAAITPDGAYAYVTDGGSPTVSVINTLTKNVVATVPVGIPSNGVAITPDGSLVYVTSNDGTTTSVIRTLSHTVVDTLAVGSTSGGIAITGDAVFLYLTNANSVLVFNTLTRSVVASVPVGTAPSGLAISGSGTAVYVTNAGSNNVSVIRTLDNTVVATVPVGTGPSAVTTTPDGAVAYVTNAGSNDVSVIRTLDNTVVATVPVGTGPSAVATTPDGTFAYVTNAGSNTVSAIDRLTNTVTATVSVGTGPSGVAIVP